MWHRMKRHATHDDTTAMSSNYVHHQDVLRNVSREASEISLNSYMKTTFNDDAWPKIEMT